MDTRRLKVERKTEDHLEKGCEERGKEGRMEGLGCGQSGGTAFVGECDGRMCLLSR